MYKQLGDLAKEIVIKVMEENRPSYPKDDFLFRPLKEHYDHCRDHIRNYGTNYDPEELEHAITRIAIMLAKIRADNDD
jgi:hypothetical protein